MKKLLFTIAMLWGIAYGQTPSKGYLRYDSVYIQKIGGNSTLIIENATRNVANGILTNAGGGRTQFSAPSAVSLIDSVWREAGNDSLFWRRAGITYAVKDSAGGGGGLFGRTDTRNNTAGAMSFSAADESLTIDSTSLFQVYSYADADSYSLIQMQSSEGSIRYLHNGFDNYISIGAGLAQIQAEDSIRLIHPATSASLTGYNLMARNPVTGVLVDYTGSVGGSIDTSGFAVVDTSAGSYGQPVLWSGGNNFYVGAGGAGFESYTEFEAGVTENAPAAGDSILTNTNYIGKYIYISRAKEWIKPGIDFEFDDDTGEIIFHPVFSANEQVIIYVSASTPTEIALQGPPWTALTFGTVSNISQTSNVWTSSTSAYNGCGLDAHTLTANGAFRARYQASDGIDFILGWNTTNVNSNYNGSVGGGDGYEYGVAVLSGGAVYRVVNGGSGVSLGVTINVGDYVRLYRTGSTIKIQTSTNGDNWTDQYTFAATTSATLYYNLNVFTTGKCYNPMYL